MSEQEFKRALSYADSAMDLLKRATVPPYPHFYELLYTYATGVNPSLNARINAIFREGDPNADITERLYNEFLKANDVNTRVTGVTTRVSNRIESMNDAIDAAMVTANAYSASLQIAAGDLTNGIEPNRLAALAAHLLSETRRMQDANHDLEKNLASSREDIAALQRDLDDVRREALLDPLTKIHNRKAFDDGIVRAVANASETGSGLCLVLIDIDNFKNFNDTWGHQTGDQVLRLVAMTLKSNIKGKDIAARYGGEEFAAILPDTDLSGAKSLSETVRKAIQAKELLKRSTNEKLGRITASFGVAQFHTDDTPSSLIERADRCLYAAKHRGRNVVITQSELTSSGVAA